MSNEKIEQSIDELNTISNKINNNDFQAGILDQAAKNIRFLHKLVFALVGVIVITWCSIVGGAFYVVKQGFTIEDSISANVNSDNSTIHSFSNNVRIGNKDGN